MTKFSYFLGSEQWQPETLIEHAKLAKEVGFDMVTISEHFHPWVDDHSASNFTWSTLGALANNTPNLDLGTGVTTPLWRMHPGVVAQASATIDRLTKSTFHLGVGTGENMNDLAAGNIYHAIYYGLNAMGPHNTQVNDTERWLITMYVQELQKGN